MFSPLHHHIPDAQCLGNSSANSPSVGFKEMHPNPEIIPTTHWFLQWGIHPVASAASALEIFPLPQSGSSKPSSSKGWAGTSCRSYLLLSAAAVKGKCPKSSTIFARHGQRGAVHLSWWQEQVQSEYSSVVSQGRFFPIAVIFTTWWRVFYTWHLCWWILTRRMQTSIQLLVLTGSTMS